MSSRREGNGLLTKNEFEKVEELNKFFSRVFVEENAVEVPEDHSQNLLMFAILWLHSLSPNPKSNPN